MSPCEMQVYSLRQISQDGRRAVSLFYVAHNIIWARGTVIARFTTCTYIVEHHNILLLGATCSGKTYLACALGMAVVRNFLTVKYIRLPELLAELAIARASGTFRKVIQQYKKCSLLILDEWLLYPLKETEARDLLEIAESKFKNASTIFCSQFTVAGWREKIGDPILADAICDRIVHDSYQVVIDCKKSMRKRKGVQEQGTGSCFS